MLTSLYNQNGLGGFDERRKNMNKLFTKIVGAALGLTMAIGVGVAVANNSKEATPVHATDSTYTFTSKAWADSTSSWTSDKYGGQLTSGQGVQVTTTYSGAGAHTKSAINNITAIEFTYCTNASKGVGSISVTIGSNAAVTYSVTKTGGTTARTTSQTYSTAQSGVVTFSVTCTQNSIYVAAIKITTQNSIPTTSVDVDPATVTLAPNATQQLTTTVLPANTTDTLSYSTTDGSVATVSSSGLITAHSDGTATITATSGNYSDTCVVTVETPSTPFITPDKTSTSGYTGCDETIGFTYGNLDNSLGVSTSNANVSAVIDNDDGSSADVVITFNTATASNSYVYLKDGSTTLATITVTSITASSVTITGLPATATLYNNSTLNLGSQITVTPTGSMSSDVSWESDDPSVATVNSSGLVTPVSNGTVNITVTSDDYPSATMTCVVTVDDAPMVYEFTFGSSYTGSPGSITSDAALKTAYSAFSTYGISGSNFTQIYGSSSYNLKLGSSNNPASITFTIPSDQYVTKVVIGTGTTVASVNLRIVSGATGATQESQAISTSSTYTFDDYLADEKSNVFTMSTSAKGAVAIASMDIYYAVKTPELHASSTEVEAVISTSTASINLTYDNFTPTSYSEVITGSSVTSVAYNTSSTPHTATFTTSATTGESTVVITGTGGGKNASVTITVNVTNPRNVTALTITTASDATTFKVGDTFDVGSLVITATFDAAPTTVVYSKANGNIGNLTSDPVIGYEFVEADIGTVTTATFELEFGSGDEFCEYTISVIDKDYAAPLTNLNSLWDGQKVYFSNGSNAAFQKYETGNNVTSVSATIHETKGIDIESTSAYQYTVHRMKVDSTVYYLFSLEDSGTTYYIKDAGTSSSNAITKVSDITDTAIYWTLEAGANDGQWVITNRSNTAKPKLQVNGTFLSCYNGGQTNPYLYAVTSYSETAVAADFASGAMHMSEDTSGQCVDYYPIAKQVWNAMSDDEKLYVDEEQPLAYARLVAWAAYHGETINGSYNIVSASRISILNTTLGKNSNTVAIIVIISMISVTAIGGYFFIRKRKEQ